MGREYVPARLRKLGMQSLQASITSAIEAWMMRHGLLPAERVASLARVITTFCYRCAPLAGEHEISRAEDYHVMARLLAVLLGVDEATAGQAGARGLLDAIERDGFASVTGPQLAASPWLRAVSELLADVAGPTGRDIEMFQAALLDHWCAVQEEAAVYQRGAGERAWAAPRDWLAETLRLRPLLTGTEPYLWCWQTLLGCWPDDSLVRALAAEGPAVRRAYPHALLDRALDAARQAHARGRPRRAPALSELEALAVVATYLANDLGSRERDRDGDGPGRESNLMLLLERYFRGDAGEHGGAARAGAAPERAEAMLVDMYNIGISRFRAFRTRALTTQDSAGVRQYLALLAGVVDGNRITTIEHAGGAAPAGSAGGARYGGLTALKRLHGISDES